jgi:predicted lipase
MKQTKMTYALSALLALTVISSPALAKWRVKPVKIVQESWTCWAAATSVWAYHANLYKRASGQSAKKAIQEHSKNLVASFKAKNCTGSKDTLKTNCLSKLRTKYGAVHQEIPKGVPLSKSLLEPKLKKSHIVAIFTIGNVGHSVVIYGVDNTKVCYMDPMIGDTECKKYHEFISSDGFYLMWKN